MAAYENVSGFNIVFDIEGVVRGPYHDVGQPFTIVFEVNQVVRGPYHDVAQPFEIVVEPGQVAHTLRGGGQSTTEWDWARGKVK